MNTTTVSTAASLGIATITAVAGLVATWGGTAQGAPRIDQPQIARPAAVPTWAQIPAKVKPCTSGSVHQDCVTQAQARQIVEAAGRDWPEFLTDTTDRPRYERTFIRLWLSQ